MYIRTNISLYSLLLSLVHYVQETDATTCSDPQPTSDNIYDFVEQHLLSLDPFSTMALGKLTYHTDFHPHYIAPKRDGYKSYL